MNGLQPAAATSLCVVGFAAVLSLPLVHRQPPADFIVQADDATLAAIEDDVRADLAKVNIQVNTRFLGKEDFNSNMTFGNFNLCFSETWGPPYDPHSYAASWKSPDEAHFAALKGMTAPTQDQLTAKISQVLVESDLSRREAQWKDILSGLHAQAIDLPFSGKRMPTVLNKRLTGYVPGQQQFEYPVHTLRVLSGSQTITVAPGAQTGLFDSVGRLDPHTYRPNEFFSNNWVYEGLVHYGDGVAEPALAEAWNITDLPGGGQEYRFALAQNVNFHDGSAWNCTVAKLNFDHVLAKPLTTGDWHGWYDLPKAVTGWSCAGTYEFVLTTRDKYYPLLQELTYIRPLRMLSPAMFKSGISTSPVSENSCHAGWGSITGNGETIRCAGITGISGTGPWKYVETLANGDVRFERHGDAGTAGTSLVREILVKKYAGHADVMAALLDGSLDAVMGAGVLEPSDFNTIRTSHSSQFHVFLGPPIMNRIIIMNAAQAPTNDLNLRKVIMHAVNKAAIIDKELYGMAEPVDALFPKNAPYCGIDLTPRWDYDIQKAELLWCPAEVIAESDDTMVIVLVVVIAVVVVLAVIVAFILYKLGKKTGAMEEKLLQSKQASEPKAMSVGESNL